jgi:peptidyl-prolyl cis-trans isomerase A (cyclophilin A)
VTTQAAAVVAAVVSMARPAAQGAVRVLVQTELGDIVLEIDTTRAPNTAANFLRYVDSGHYNGGTFHRTVKMDNSRRSGVRGLRARRGGHECTQFIT